jgi:hypothetical protein
LTIGIAFIGSANNNLEANSIVCFFILLIRFYIEYARFN